MTSQDLTMNRLLPLAAFMWLSIFVIAGVAYYNVQTGFDRTAADVTVFSCPPGED